MSDMRRLIEDYHSCLQKPAEGELYSFRPIAPIPIHDGRLGSDDNVYLVQYMLKQRPRYASVWIGRDTELRQDEIWLSPEQALSLLNWLRQEEDQLIQMAKERE